MADLALYRDVIELCEYLDIEDKDFKQQVYDNITDGLTDFELHTGAESWRFINEDEIDDIAKDEIQELVKDTYLYDFDFDKLWWIEIDWEKTAENVISADGYGHHFATYDGNEYEWEFISEMVKENYYIFRTD